MRTNLVLRDDSRSTRTRSGDGSSPEIPSPVRTCGDEPSVVFSRRFALSAQPHFFSLSSSKKEERAGERRLFLSIPPLSDSLPARSSQGERGKTPPAFCVPNTTDKPSPPLILNMPWLLFLPAIFLLGGCAHSPTVDVLGSYFPAWMLCIIVGLVGTLIVRLLLIGFGIYTHLRLKPVLASCTAIFFTLAVWLVFFKN